MSPEARRLHKAAIGVYVAKAVREGALPLLVLIVVGVFRQGLDAGALETGALYAAIGVAIAGITGYVRWSTTRWWVDRAGIHRRSGFLSTKQTDIPYSRVQSLDREQGVVQRLFGVHAVHVQTGGGGARGEIVLEAITEADLEALRGLIATPAAPVEDVAQRRLSRADLLLAALTAGQLGVILPLLAGAGQLAQNVAGDDAERDAIRLIPHAAHEWALALVGLLALAWLLSVAGAVVAFAGFTAIRDGGRLRIRRGLLEHREATVPVERIRAVVVVEGVLRRPLRLAAVRVEVIGHAKEPSAAQTLFPLLRRSAVRPFLDELLPELADDLDRLAPLPRRALRRYVLPPALGGAAAGAVAWALVAGPWALLLALPAAAYGALRYRDAGWRAAGGRLAVRSLRIARTTVLAPARLRESQTVAQNPLQRRAGLADLEIAFGKRTVARVHHLEATTAFDSLAS
ncbi:MAG TPA: PH domain-containing protein [Solirubrobacteraceae bacterium]|jgi:putative membrane protein